jgi:hypothetical protein
MVFCSLVVYAEFLVEQLWLIVHGVEGVDPERVK